MFCLWDVIQEKKSRKVSTSASNVSFKSNCLSSRHKSRVTQEDGKNYSNLGREKILEYVLAVLRRCQPRQVRKKMVLSYFRMAWPVFSMQRMRRICGRIAAPDLRELPLIGHTHKRCPINYVLITIMRIGRTSLKRKLLNSWIKKKQDYFDTAISIMILFINVGCLTISGKFFRRPLY